MNKAQLKRLFSYGVVGVIVSTIYVLCAIFFTETVGFTPIIASALAYIASFMLSFFANHHVVFKSKEDMSKTVVRFALVSAFVFVLTTSIMYLTVEVFKIPYLYGVAVVLVVIPLSNFSLNLYWTFRDTPSTMPLSKGEVTLMTSTTEYTARLFSKVFNAQKDTFVRQLISLIVLLAIWAFMLRDAFSGDRLFSLYEDNEFLLGPVFSGISYMYLHGVMPLRLDTILGGFPLYNFTQITPYYPFYFFFLDIYNGYLSSVKSLHWLTLLHLLILLVNMNILLRTIGVNRIAAITGATLFTFGADMFTYSIWLNIVAPYSWLPLYIAGILGIFQNQAVRKSSIFVFIAMLMIVLSSPAQPLIHAVLLTVFISLGYIVHCFRLKKPRQLIKPLLLIGVISILCFLICAPMLLPALMESGKMIRWIGAPLPVGLNDKIPFESYVIYKFPINNIWQLFFYKHGDMVGGAYIGFFAIPLAMLAFLKKGNWLAGVFFWVAVYALLSSFGDDAGLAYINYNLPLLDKIREPSRFLILFHFSIVILASMGLSNLSQALKEGESVNVRCSYLLSIAAFIVSVVFFWGIYQFSNVQLVAGVFRDYEFKIDVSDYVRFFACLTLILLTLFLLRHKLVVRKSIALIWSVATLVSLATAVHWQPPLTLSDSVYVQKNYAALDMAIAHVAEMDPDSKFRLIFDGNVDHGQASMLASYRGVRTFHFYINPAPKNQVDDFLYGYSPYYTYEGAAFLICKQCNISGHPSFKLLKTYGDYAIYFDANAYPRFFLGDLAGFFKDTRDFVIQAQSTPPTSEIERNVYLETGMPVGMPVGDLKHTSKPLPYKAENYTDKNWVNGIANKWATAFLVKTSNKAKIDLAVGKKVSFSDGTIRTIIKHQENENSLIVFLDGEPLDGNKLGYPNAIKVIESNTKTRTDCNLLTLFSSATRHDLLVDCDAGHILVLNEYHDGNWRGYINGAKTNILKVNGNQNGIVLTANAKFVTFKYRPSIFFKSLALSLLGLILFVLAYFLAFKTKIYTHEQK